MKASGASSFWKCPTRARRRPIPDILSGRVDLFFDSASVGAPLHPRPGKVRGMALLAPERSPLAPDMMTLDEAGVPGLGVELWIGLFARAKTPPEAIAKLRREIRAALPDLKERFEKSGGEAWDMPDDKLDGFVASEYESLDQTDPRGRHQAGLSSLYLCPLAGEVGSHRQMRSG